MAHFDGPSIYKPRVFPEAGSHTDRKAPLYLSTCNLFKVYVI